MIERIFGVLKHRFRILLLAPEYSLAIQARIPAALAVIHNFIWSHEPDDDESDNDNNDKPIGGRAENNDDEAEWAESGLNKPNTRRDTIAQEMWDHYQIEHIDCGLTPPE